MEETARLDQLRDLALDRIKDTAAFSTLTQMAADLFGCPIALISIVEEHRLWFLGRTGTDLAQAPRDHAFCSACIANGEALHVTDAARDSRFADHPLVKSTLGIRSYLGVPITSDSGVMIGTLCVASDRPEAFANSDITRLRGIAQLAEQGIAVRTKTLALARANASLGELNQLFKQAETAARIGSWRLDLRSGDVQWSDQVFAIHGVSPSDDVDLQNAINFYEPEDRERVRRAVDQAVETGKPFSFEATIRRTDGQLRRIRSMGERIDIDGQPECVAGVFVDCTDEHLHLVALQRAATRDSLTGLYNRSEFDRRLAKALGNIRVREHDQVVTVMLLDLDGFKDVNDRLGHLVGDRLLVQIAQSLDRNIKAEAFLARWGGDEFAILFQSDCTLDDASDFADRLIADIAEQVRIGDSLIQVGATCGISQMTGISSGEEIVRRADLALYHAKMKARGSVRCWSEDIESAQAARQSAIRRLTEALNDGRAFASYQPIVLLEDNSTMALEALLRLRDEEGNVISAGEIFPALLDPLLARRVARFMIDQVAAEAPRLLALYGPKVRIGINVTEADLRRGDFLKVMDDLIASSVLQPGNIVLEVTETMLIQDEAGHIRDMLCSLDRRGFTIALDDFGTGYSSLTHLRDFPIRKVKIDKEFIATMTRDHQSRMIVQAMVQMGQSLGLRIVAEGVETQEQLSFLKSIGCSHAQGFWFARPAAIAELEAQGSKPDPALRAQRNAA